VPGAAAYPPWTLRDLGLGVSLTLLGMVGAIALAVLVGLIGDPRVDATAALAAAVITLAFSTWLVVIVFLVARRRGFGLAEVGLGWPQARLWYWPLLTWLAGLTVVAGYAVTVSLIAAATGSDLSRLVEGNALQMTEANTWLTWAILGLAIVVGAPLGEELFFRGLVFPAVRARWGTVAGVMISGAMFALVHFEISVFVPFWGIGMLFALSYHRSGSLWTPVIAHAIFNGVSFAATIAGAA